MRLAPLIAWTGVACLALSGCSGKGQDTTTSTFTCPGGKVVQVSGNATANPSSACPRPKPPSVSLAAPAALRVFRPATFTWTVLPGDHQGGHSMLSSLRLSASSVPGNSTLKGPDSYGTEIAKKEHQNLPVTVSADYTFKTPGMYFVRVYATILSNDDPNGHDYWSGETMLMVSDVAATGNTTTITQPVGNAAAPPTVDHPTMHAGDALVFKNDDVVNHTLTLKDGPVPVAPLKAALMASSPAVVLKAPGAYTFDVDDAVAQTVKVEVQA